MNEFPEPEFELDLHDGKLAVALRHWCQDHPDPSESRSIEQKRLAELLGIWLASPLLENPVKWNRGWWPDGIVHLELDKRDNKLVVASGVTIWVDNNARQHAYGDFLAPFEIEFYFASPSSFRFRKTVVRFGIRDGKDGIEKCPYSRIPHVRRQIFEKRPRRNSDWALAIEIDNTVNE
ncbi:MAG: hypothetical protein KDA92_16370 [Planctomycetales bacterium]|nr:hypothetical protein [Planctomycetales bacterium]